VKYADEKYNIGPGPASQSYLCKQKIIDVALKSGAEGIHPGYGFMAENSEFAEMCEKNKIEFIGPPISAMKLMGSKIDSKKSMIKAGVRSSLESRKRLPTMSERKISPMTSGIQSC